MIIDHKDSLSKFIKIDDLNDEVVIHGIRYSGSFFRGLAFGVDERKWFQIIERLDGSMVISEEYR